VPGGAAFRGIDDIPREQRIPAPGEVRLPGKLEEGGQRLFGEMRLRKIEVDAGFAQAEPGKPVGLAGEQRPQRRLRGGVEAGPGGIGHDGRVSRDAEGRCIG
jgi:hypothetical protein